MQTKNLVYIKGKSKKLTWEIKMEKKKEDNKYKNLKHDFMQLRQNGTSQATQY